MARYDSVNGEWPAELPPLTGQEALTAAKRLYRLAVGKAWGGKWKLTSGNRYSYPRYGTFYINPAGWHDLVHSLSHHCHRRLAPGQRPHGGSHAFIEREMIKHVVSSGWLAGKLRRPEKPKADKREVRLVRIEARIAAWQAKARRAENALRKLERQRKRLMRDAQPSAGRNASAQASPPGLESASNVGNH